MMVNVKEQMQQQINHVNQEHVQMQKVINMHQMIVVNHINLDVYQLEVDVFQLIHV